MKRLAPRRSRKWVGTGLGDGVRHPIDLHVGSRLRMHRVLAGMRQADLADALGITFQQVQKYERGTNRISASRLKMISDVLRVPISYFFIGLAPSSEERIDKELEQAETLQLIRFYYAMPEAARRQFFEMLKSVAASSAQPAGADDAT
jgi:transcriptional regulator with XRE-family HTH domain